MNENGKGAAKNWSNSLSGLRCLVTGGAGFLGSHLCARLIDAGASVVVLDLLPKSAKSLLSVRGLTDKVEYFEGDVRSRFDLRRVLRSPIDVSFHLAGQPISSLSNREPRVTVDVNAGGTRNLCDTLAERGECVIVLASSACVYGIPESGASPLRETDTLREGFYVYTESKQKAELEVLTATEMAGGIARFVNLYGPGDRHFSRIIPRTIRQLLLNTNPSLSRGDGTTVLDFLYIDDAVDALLALSNQALHSANGDPKEVFNFGVGSKNATTIRDLVARMSCLYDGKARDAVPKSPSVEPAMVKFLDPTKAQEKLGWRAQVLIEEGLRMTIEWYRRHLFDIAHLEDDRYPFEEVVAPEPIRTRDKADLSMFG